jgi:hypothetical protein
MGKRDSSRPGSTYTIGSATSHSYKRPVSAGSTLFARKAWPSTKLKGEIEKPWVKYPDPAHRTGKIIFWVLVALGFVAGAAGTFSFFFWVGSGGNIRADGNSHLSRIAIGAFSRQVVSSLPVSASIHVPMTKADGQVSCHG